MKTRTGLIKNSSQATDETPRDAKRVVPEDETRYPEQFFFGVLPEWGAYIRHAKNIEFVNMELETRTPDERKKIHLEDVDGFVER